MQLNEAKTDDDFQDLIGSDEYDFRFSCGVTQPSVKLKLKDRDKIISSLCLHFTVLAELEQLHHGLSTLEVSTL